MQRWEYQVLLVRNEMVLEINRELVATTKFWSGTQGPLLHEYLNRAGADGWEVVAMSPISEKMSDMLSINIILKRPRG